MRLNSKVTWGLAWAGLALVVAVPSADFLTGRMGTGSGTAAVVSPRADVVQTASVTSTLTKTGVIITPAGSAVPADTDPVDKLLKSGKPMPDYISDGPATAAAPQVASAPQASSSSRPPSAPEDTIQTASINPVVPPVAPVPFPSTARPPDIAKPTLPKTTDPVVIVDDNAPATDEASIDTNGGPVPPEPIGDDNRLSRYLDRQGLLDNASTDGRSSASVTVVDRPRDYDPNGFYLSDGPNNRAAERRARLRRLYEAGLTNNDDGSDFTLF